MIVYLLLVGIILLLNRMRNHLLMSDLWFSRLMCFVFILITGLRHTDVGADTTVYYLMFEEAKNEPFGLYTAAHRDVGFCAFFWVVAHLGGSFQLASLLVATTFYIPFFILIRKYSADLGLSLIVFMAFTFFQFTMTGMRQTMALGFSILFFLELKSSRHRWGLLLLLISVAVSLHKSAFIVLFYVALFYYYKKYNNLNFTYFLIPLFFLFRAPLTSIFLPVLENEGFKFDDTQTGGGTVTLLVYICLFVYGLVSNIGRKSGGMNRFDMGMMALIVCLQCLVLQNSILFRGVWYFSIYLCIIIPEIVQTISDQNRKIINIMMYLALLFMYTSITIGSANVLPYRFFWQE